MSVAGGFLANVDAFFLAAFQKNAAQGTGGEFVAFEALGFSPGCCVNAVDPTVAGQADAAADVLATLGDELPGIQGGQYVASGASLSDVYNVLLAASTAVPGPGAALFAAIKTRALQDFDDNSGSDTLDGPPPATATPADWYVLGDNANWQTYSYTEPPPPATPPPPAPAYLQLAWKIPTPAPALAGPAREPMALLKPQVPANVPKPGPAQAAPAPAPAPHPVLAVARPGLAPLGFHPPLVLTPLRPTPPPVVPQQVQAANFTVSFQYCVVNLRRGWLSWEFLASPGWYVPGTPSGYFSGAAGGATDALTVVPSAFIAVRDLVIEAPWGGSDAAASSNAVAFGPFSLAGRGPSSATSITNPGVQIIAWVCNPVTAVPPEADPNLAAPPSAAPAASTPAPAPSAGPASGSNVPAGASAPAATPAPAAASAASAAPTAAPTAAPASGTASTASTPATGASGATTAPAASAAGAATPAPSPSGSGPAAGS